MTLLFSKKNFLQWILLYLFIIMHGAVIWSANFGESYLAFAFIFVVTFLIIYKYKLSIPSFYFYYVAGTAICYFISAITTGVGLNSGLNIKTVVITAMNFLLVICLYKLDTENVATRFIKLITFFATISLIFYSLQIILGNEFPSDFFQYVDWGRGHNGVLMYSFTSDIRNYGIFYEPGVYQALLIGALFICLFKNTNLKMDSKKVIITVIILIITLITTGSTTGYISLSILLVGFLLSKSSQLQKKIKKRLLFGILLMVIFVIYDLYVKAEQSLIYTYVINKFIEMNISNGSYQEYSSGGARIFIIECAIETLCTKPFFGSGATYINQLISEQYWDGFGTGNVFFGTIASKGLVTTLVSISPIFILGYKNNKKTIEYFTFIAIYFNVIIAQSQIMYGVFLFILLISNTNKSKTEVYLK